MILFLQNLTDKNHQTDNNSNSIQVEGMIPRVFEIMDNRGLRFSIISAFKKVFSVKQILSTAFKMLCLAGFVVHVSFIHYDTTRRSMNLYGTFNYSKCLRCYDNKVSFDLISLFLFHTFLLE